MYCTVLWSSDNECKFWFGLVELNATKKHPNLGSNATFVLNHWLTTMNWLWTKTTLLELNLNWSDQLLVWTRCSFSCQVSKSMETYHTDVSADVFGWRSGVMSANLQVQLCYCDNVAVQRRDPVGGHVVLKGILPVLKWEIHPLFTHADQGQKPENSSSPVGINMKLLWKIQPCFSCSHVAWE